MISVKEYTPSPFLAPFVDKYYRGSFNTLAEPNRSFKIIPNGCLELIIHLKELYCKLPTDNHLAYTPDYMLIGMFSRAYQVHFSETVPIFSIRFKPEALPYILRIRGSEIFENYGDIEAVLENKFLDFCHQIREEKSVGAMIARTEIFLLNIISKQKVEENYVTRAARIISNAQINNVQEISTKVNISRRQLERKFRELIGISPKQYLRLIRINKVMQMLEQNQSLNLTDIAYHCGYFDQAHFIKDFKHITDQTPSSYINDRQRFINL
ncbi:MAG: helix-turn-helix domain-containing protein [Bacteroidia bacterium]|nr:helix-turn-helix domain-containing protein [Bacteroidia bacterium]